MLFRTEQPLYKYALQPHRVFGVDLQLCEISLVFLGFFYLFNLMLVPFIGIHFFADLTKYPLFILLLHPPFFLFSLKVPDVGSMLKARYSFIHIHGLRPKVIYYAPY